MIHIVLLVVAIHQIQDGKSENYYLIITVEKIRIQKRGAKNPERKWCLRVHIYFFLNRKKERRKTEEVGTGFHESVTDR